MPDNGFRQKVFSMIIAVGVDLVDLVRIERLVDSDPRFVERVFTASERNYCETQARRAAAYGARFAAKEAVMKCLGTGWSQGVAFQQVEVLRQVTGAVAVGLSGRAAEVAKERGIARIELSLSHGEQQAIAFAVATCP